MKINYNQVGQRISLRRRAMGMTQCKLSEKISVTNNHISNIENGHTIPSLDVFIKICEALDVSPDYFLLGAIKRRPNKNVIDKLSLCTNDSIKIISDIIDVILASQKAGNCISFDDMLK
ncbi:MAG: helix-turn-helix transcriptional regulator [Oscillospiraceae bacterium]